jgi:hypothetical protein
VNWKSYWKEKKKSNRPSDWPHKNEKTKQFTDGESTKILKALDALPPGLMPKSLNGIYRMGKSIYFPNPGAHGGGAIVLYDTAFSRPILQRVIAHELAHQIYDELEESIQNDYKVTTNWLEVQGKSRTVTIRRQEGFVKPEAKLSPNEDFANNIEFYIFEPSRLKLVTPAAYDWIKRRFGDNFNIRRECEK